MICLGKFYLVDSGYPNSNCFLAPYRGVTYHLQEYRERRHGPRSPRELFNYTHSSLRNCIERTFGVWKARFPILKSIKPYPYDKQKLIPIACAVIHNFIRMWQSNDEILQQYYDDALPVAEIEGENVYEEHGLQDDDGVDVSPFIQNRGDNASMNARRDAMANQMWEAYAQRPWYTSRH